MDNLLVDYMICKECKNPDTYGVICVKCGECGRTFVDGILTNDVEYPGYDPEDEE